AAPGLFVFPPASPGPRHSGTGSELLAPTASTSAPDDCVCAAASGVLFWHQCRPPPEEPGGVPAVLLLEPERTQFDLSWRMFGVRVRVHPMFWLISCLMGANLLNHPSGNGVGLLGIWVGCVFVSILVHEFGHVLMGRAFGADGQVVLYA